MMRKMILLAFENVRSKVDGNVLMKIYMKQSSILNQRVIWKLGHVQEEERV
jgi:hypothetical protein